MKIMERDHILIEINSIFEKVLDSKNLDINKFTTSNDVKGWDSLMHLLLIDTIENQFDISFTVKEIQELQNIGDMIDLIIKKYS